VVVSNASALKRYARGVFPVVAFLSQVDDGESDTFTIRETSSSLGPLLTALIVLGVCTLIATAVFWRLTRPNPDINLGESDG